jgi:signal transduction histidine kinase
LTEDEVPGSLKTTIYRISQETLNNIAKHSAANHVLLALSRNDGALELVIQDNGRGFDVEKKLAKTTHERGLGLSSMKERVELTGGSFSIQSAEGKGTLIRATWPIES